jgi:hypothetical protein
MDHYRFDTAGPDLDRHQNGNSDPDQHQNNADHNICFKYLPGSPILLDMKRLATKAMLKKGKERCSFKKLADLAFLFLRRCFSPSLSVELC